jgi:hypothetical protein
MGEGRGEGKRANFQAFNQRDLPGNFYRATGGRQVSRILHLPTVRTFLQAVLEHCRRPKPTCRLKLRG